MMRGIGRNLKILYMLSRIIVMVVSMCRLWKEIGMSNRLMLMPPRFTMHVFVCRVIMQHRKKQQRKKQ